ncbi:MAG: gfo/Idh/MocA family oxidoreductase, partial [Clostridia bacterium]|nr:gfo/Idh/MocA family oxidoreductase [Clostridia bacterium]
GNDWGNWNPDEFSVEDSAFGFVVMENGATIVLESSWALNTLDVREAVTTLHGTKAGADMTGGVRINGVRGGQQYVMNCSVDASGAAFNDAHGKEDPSTREARLWIAATRGGAAPLVKPEEALCVTEILEGIYESAKTGKPYYFN